MSFHQLTQIVSPPRFPVKPGASEEWQEIERRLGISLPADFKLVCNVYGKGEFKHFLWLYSPFSEDANFFKFKDLLLESYRGGRELFPEYCPFPAYPEPGGLLPWGGDENGDSFYWLTEGSPDEWTVVLYDDDMVGYERYPVSLTGFLAGWLTGEIAPIIFSAENVLQRSVPVFDQVVPY